MNEEIFYYLLNLSKIASLLYMYCWCVHQVLLPAAFGVPALDLQHKRHHSQGHTQVSSVRFQPTL